MCTAQCQIAKCTFCAKSGHTWPALSEAAPTEKHLSKPPWKLPKEELKQVCHDHCSWAQENLYFETDKNREEFLDKCTAQCQIAKCTFCAKSGHTWPALSEA